MDSNAQTVHLDYERRIESAAISRPGWFRTARFCAVTPLAVGTTIFLLWLVTRWDWLMLAGTLTICLGCMLFVSGLAFLAGYVLNERRVRGTSRRSLYRRSAIVLGLLLINFPLAASYVAAADWLHHRIVIHVVNASSAPIDRFQIGGGITLDNFGAVPSGTTVTHGIRDERGFRCVIDQRGASVEHDLDYQLHSPGDATITVTDAGVNVVQSK